MEEDDATTLYCGNIGSKVTESILYELFLQAGPIDSLRMPKKDNAHRGFAFVKYKHESAVQYAVELFEGTELDGRQLTLRNNSATKRPHSTGGYDYEQTRRNEPHFAPMPLYFVPQPLLMMPPQQLARSYNNSPHYNAPPHRHDNWRNTPYHRRSASDRRHSDGRHSDRHSDRRHRDRH